MLRGWLVFLLCAALAFVAAACDEPADDLPPTAAPQERTQEPYVDLKATEQARATPTATPVAATADCPQGVDAAHACSAARGLAESIRRDGVDALVRAARPVTVTCGSNFVSLEIICAGVAAGDTRAGLIYANKVFHVLPEKEYREYVSPKALGDSRIVAVGCPRSLTGDLDCSGAFIISLDPTPSEPLEHYRLFVLLLVWDDASQPAILAHYGGLYAGREAWAGGPGRYPLPGVSEEAVNVWWYPWRP